MHNIKNFILLSVFLAGFWQGGAQGQENTPVQTAALPDAEILNGPFTRADHEIFQQPPPVFHPETWFHFIGGNVKKSGITADLEAIKKAGISGIQLFHGQFGGEWPGVSPQIRCLSESWDEMIRFVGMECRRLGLRFTMQNCPGWAMSGGPWITPENAMRHLVWSRTDINGGSPVNIALPQPQPGGEEWRDYREVAVIAFPTPLEDTGQPLRPVSVKSNRNDLPWSGCFGTEKGAKIELKAGEGPVWIEVDLGSAATLRTIEFPSVRSFNHNWCYEPGIRATVHALLPQGEEEVAQVDMPQSNWQDNKPFSVACTEKTARKYRITIETLHDMTFSTIRLFSGARMNNWEAQAAWVLRSLDRRSYPEQSEKAWVNPLQVKVLTGKMDARGTLAWDVPPGKWTVLRIGHVNTGKRNGPAPPEATGWECNKLSPKGAEVHFAGYIGRITGTGGPARNGLLQGMLLDSWECETQTWTEGMEVHFRKICGYPLWQWMPALMGYTMENPETTTKFLRDWRATINELLVKNFFGRMAELGKENGLSLSFETASGDVFPADILEYYKYADVPMCEFWHPRSEGYVGSLNFKPIRPCASAAHLYGKSRVAAEAFTSFNLTYNESPGMLKQIANIHFAEGVNHLVFHTYTHNPRTDWRPPGTSFGSGIGTPFLRGQTWWKEMPEFTAYLSRCGFMLERGKPVSDVLWYLGDELDHKPSQDAPFPAGYKYDYCNPDILMNRLTVSNGQLVTPEGVSYRLLWLKDCSRMLPETLEKIVALVQEGATVAGAPPRGVATLKGGDKAVSRLEKSIRTLWGIPAEPGIRKIGKGRLWSGMPLEDVLHQMGVVPDLDSQGLMWNHRQTDDADWYFVAAEAGRGFIGSPLFRASGMVEIWDPMTGKVKTVTEVHQDNGRSRVPLDLPPSGALFVVFSNKPNANSENRKPVDAPFLVRRIQGPWTLSFPQDWDAPSTLRQDLLRSWTELDLPDAAKAFSGTVTYTAEFELDGITPGSTVELDLGSVEVLASVRINENKAGTVWSPPYSMDISRWIKPGKNLLTIDVTNTWFNRLAYDAGLPVNEQKTWTINGPKNDSPLKPSGLLGPVTLRITP